MCGQLNRYQLGNKFLEGQEKKTGLARHGWMKQKEDFVKLNVDAGFDLDSGSGSSRAIIRDDRRFFLAASCCGILFVSYASTVEARALRDGLILEGQVGCRLEVNSDCIEVIEVMQNGGNSFDLAAAIYEECTSLCHNFVEVQLFSLS
jgi:hypothetical protein